MLPVWPLATNRTRIEPEFECPDEGLQVEVVHLETGVPRNKQTRLNNFIEAWRADAEAEVLLVGMLVAATGIGVTVTEITTVPAVDVAERIYLIMMPTAQPANLNGQFIRVSLHQRVADDLT